MERAARLAAAALLDTLAVCAAAYGVARCHLALDGDLARRRARRRAARRHRGLDGPPPTGRRTSRPGSSTPTRTRAASSGAPVVQVGMDTPHLDPRRSAEVGAPLTHRDDAVLGPAYDGGWWLLGVGGPHLLDHLPTCRCPPTAPGRSPAPPSCAPAPRCSDVETLRDVDEVEDAESVAAAAPDSASHSRRACAMTAVEPADPSSFSEVYSDALRGEAVHGARHRPGRPAAAGARLARPVSHADRVLLGHCRGRDPRRRLRTRPDERPPRRPRPRRAGRRHRARGRRAGPRRGVAALRRNVFDPLPGEGRWDTVLLADGNIGIGGAPVAAAASRAPSCSTARAGSSATSPRPGPAYAVTTRAWSPGLKRSGPFPWAQVGPEAIEALAAERRARRRSISTSTTAAGSRC